VNVGSVAAQPEGRRSKKNPLYFNNETMSWFDINNEGSKSMFILGGLQYSRDEKKAQPQQFTASYQHILDGQF
jgi:hypothetical protein